MRKLVLITCVSALLVGAGCDDRWVMEWPRRIVPEPEGAAALPGDKPNLPSDITPEQKIAQLQRQIKTLRERLDVVEDENAELRTSSGNAKQLREQLKKQAFAIEMQKEDLKVLKTAAVERDLYKSRVERLEKEVKDLNAKIAQVPAKPK